MSWRLLISFLNHRDAPAWSGLVVSMIALIIPVVWVVVAILAEVWLINMLWLEPKLDLIKQYSILMKLLPRHLDYPSCWKEYFESMQGDLDGKFDKLNENINKVISFRYRLLWIDIPLTEFIELLKDTNTLNGDFKDMIECENIPKHRRDWVGIEDKYKDFISKLNQPEFIEIKSTVQKDLSVSSSLLESKWELIDNHNSELVKTIHAWQGLLPPEIPLTEELTDREQYDIFNISFIEKIETLPFFGDNDIFHHSHGLESIWNNFKSISKKYRLDKRELYKLIREYICQQLKNQNINESGIKSGFCVSVYIDLIIEARGNVNEYKYFKDDAGNQQYWVYYCKAFTDGSRNDGTCNQVAITNDLEKLERLHAGMMKECKAQYIGMGKKLIETEAKLREAEDILKEALKTAWFTRMDCYVIKRGKIDGST
jgi:hypothetical protein